MFLRSSMHLFSSKTDYLIDYLTDTLPRNSPEWYLIDDYFEKVEQLRGEDLWQLHENDYNLIQHYFELYDGRTRGDIIKEDFESRGWSLNIYGDIITTPNVVNCISSRIFACADAKKGVMHYTTLEMSKEIKAPVVNHSLGVRKDGGIECRLYLAAKKTICIINKDTDSERCYDEGSEMLPVLYPTVDWQHVLSLQDVLEFSKQISKDLNIVTGDENYLRFLSENCTFINTYKLYNIYKLNQSS